MIINNVAPVSSISTPLFFKSFVNELKIFLINIYPSSVNILKIKSFLNLKFFGLDISCVLK
jgi:hypothetical protein